ncbi:MAG TPA: hypothetical protein VFI31_04100 [Pirellulales bacterium]|nr:hypothetical protein [Pirellulales bacterium]
MPLLPATSVADDLDRPRFASGKVWLALALVFAAGILLRLIWLEDIEYKGDEAWTWLHASAAGRTEPFSWVGMPTSAGPENPGMSLWVFVPLAWLSDGPVDLARGIACLGMASLGVWVWFACRLPAAEREMWLWAAALSAVNPLTVVHHRKIWPNCMFPLLVSLFLMCWQRRERRLPAFFWGVLGACLAQINLSAGFFSLSFVVWACLANRRSVAWASWFAGSGLASLPLIPWYHYVSTVSRQPRVSTPKWARLFEFKFPIRWLTEPLGFGLDHGLGDDWVDFLRQPVVEGTATWFVALLHFVALAAGVVIGWNWLKKWRATSRGWRSSLFPTDSYTALVCSAAFWGYGVLLTLTCLPMHRHYMIVAYPIALLWVAYAALQIHRGDLPALALSRKLLTGLVVVELLLSASFLSYVHLKRDIHGDYGVALSAQRLAAPADGSMNR